MGRQLNFRQFRNGTQGTLVLALAFLGFGYQNCTKVQIADMSSTDKLTAAGTLATGPQYATLKVGDQDSLPPLKLIFVVDNSETMYKNQISLSTAFSKMFAGENATNLSSFDTKAYVISTSQAYLDPSDSQASRLPQLAPASLAGTLYSDFTKKYRTGLLDGSIAGDLVGYQVTKTTDDSGAALHYLGTPVAGFHDDGTGKVSVQLEIAKPRGASVADFATEFQSRIGILNPNASALDSVGGVLDHVVDNESGLCALARMVKDNTYVKPGDIAAYIVVSDEDDNDPSGSQCVDSLLTPNSKDSFVDGSCLQPETSLTYRSPASSPTPANCNVDYQNGFNYTFKYQAPTTDVSYYTKQTTFDALVTNVSYSTSTQVYNQLQTAVSYQTASQSYDVVSTAIQYYIKTYSNQVPQVLISYYDQTKCVHRDGILISCPASAKVIMNALPGQVADCPALLKSQLPAGALSDSTDYPSTCAGTAAVIQTGNGNCPAGTTGANCQTQFSPALSVSSVLGLPGSAGCVAFAQASGALPAEAEYADSAHLPTCTKNATVHVPVGSCSSSDLGVQNCVTTYTAASSAQILSGVPGSATCANFARNRLPAGAVYDVAGHLPTCASASNLANQVGSCQASDPNVSNCHTEFSTAMTPLWGAPLASQTCEAYATYSLPASAVRGDSAHAITCTAGTTVTGFIGACKPTDQGIVNCKTTYSLATVAANLPGAPTTSQTCAAFVANKLPDGAVYSDTGYLPACKSGAASAIQTISNNESFSNWTTYEPAAGDACSTALLSKIETGLQISGIPTCQITSFSTSSGQLGQSCAAGDAQSICTASGGTKRSCSAGTEVPAGDPYNAPATTVVDGTFTCDTLCSGTNFCQAKAGTVGANYSGCSTTVATPKKTDFQAKVSSSNICAAGQNMVVTKGPYRTAQAVQKVRVGGVESDKAIPSALADYIQARSQTLFGSDLASVSLFVRQPGEKTGVNGSVGTSYNTFAKMMGGHSQSVLSSAEGYASALQSLSGQLRSRLDRSFTVKALQDGQVIRQVWLMRQGADPAGVLLDTTDWNASAGTLTLATSVEFAPGDQIKVEYW